MFRYLEKHSSWGTLEEKQVATIEELLKLCKSGDVERVIIPMTYYGYGATLIDISNARSIERHYRKARFKSVQYNLTMSANQFVRNEHYRELIEQLQEQYPVFDDQDYSNLETERKLEHVVDEISYLLENEEEPNALVVRNTLYQTKERVQEILESGEWNERIEWWDYVEIDNDGATPYATKEDVSNLAALVKAKAQRESGNK